MSSVATAPAKMAVRFMRFLNVRNCNVLKVFIVGIRGSL